MTIVERIGGGEDVEDGQSDGDVTLRKPAIRGLGWKDEDFVDLSAKDAMRSRMVRMRLFTQEKIWR